jgi:hypothetical protein
MKRLLFISLFLLLKCVTTNAQNQRISVDLLGLGISLSSLNSTDNIHWYNLTYESKRKEEKTWDIRTSFLQFKSSSAFSPNSNRQIKISAYKKRYLPSRFLGKPFMGSYVALSHLTDFDARENTTYRMNAGGGVLLGVNFYLSKDVLIEFSGGLGLGLSSSREANWQNFDLLSPSFLDINLCHEF